MSFISEEGSIGIDLRLEFLRKISLQLLYVLNCAHHQVIPDYEGRLRISEEGFVIIFIRLLFLRKDSLALLYILSF